MAFAKFEENRFRIDGEIAENHAILVNLTASINTFRSRKPSIILNIYEFKGKKHVVEYRELGQVEMMLYYVV